MARKEVGVAGGLTLTLSLNISLTLSLTLSLSLSLSLRLSLTLARTVLGLGLVAREQVGVAGGQVLERRLVRSLVIPPRARGPLAITPVVTRP